MDFIKELGALPHNSAAPPCDAWYPLDIWQTNLSIDNNLSHVKAKARRQILLSRSVSSMQYRKRIYR